MATQEVSWYERTHGVTTPPPHPLPVPPKSPKVPGVQGINRHQAHPGHNGQCQCCIPARPPKPTQLGSNSATSSPKKPAKKPPMPLPIAQPLNPNPCSCSHQDNPMVGPYENYDVPKMPFLVVSIMFLYYMFYTNKKST